MRECGLKCVTISIGFFCDNVTPYAGVWIEIALDSQQQTLAIVTPYAGVWIEIFEPFKNVFKVKSLPMRECGLK